MATNNDGMGGVKIEHIALEQTTLIGVQSPNKRPSTRESNDRVKIPTVKFKDTTGITVVEEPVYDCDVIDNSWLSYGGKYTLGVGNKWHIRVGAGGIYTETLGPKITDGEMIINNAKKGFIVQCKLFQLISTERTMISGKRLDFDFDMTQFIGNVTFANNVLMNGGLYVNGELMCNHITTQKQMNTTDFNEDTQGFINPDMSFHVYQGQSLAAKTYVLDGILGGVFNALDATDSDELLSGCQIDADIMLNTDFLTQILPGLDVVVKVINIPIKISFPKGISLLSDATFHQNPTIYPTIHSKPRILGDAKEKSDIFGPGHQHTFAGPSCSLIGDTQSMYNEGKKITETTPLKHKSNCWNGAESIDKAIEEGKEVAESYFSKYLKKMKEFFLPTWFSGGS